MPDAMECDLSEGLPAQIGDDGGLQSGRDRDEDDEHAGGF